MEQASTLLQPSRVFCSLLEKWGKPSIFLEHKECMHLAATSAQLETGCHPVGLLLTCQEKQATTLKHGYKQDVRQGGDPHTGMSTHWRYRDREGRMPPALASPRHFLVHNSGSSLLSPLLLAKGFQLPTLMAGKILAPCTRAACWEENHMEMEEAIAQSTGTAAFAHVFWETGGASSVFFQLSVNQSP